MGSNVVFDNPYLDRCLRFSWYLDTIMLLLLGDAFVMFGPDLVANMDDWDYTFYDGWSDVVWFLFLFIFIYHTFDAILGHISLSIDIYRSSWSCMIISTYKIYTETMTCLLSYHDPLVEPLLGHTVKLILSDIVMILWWSYLRRIDSHIIISVEYMSDLLCIHIELLWSHQDGPNVLVAILGHIFLDYPHGRMCQLLYWGIFPIFWLWRWLFSHGAITIFFIQLRDIYSHYWSQYRWFIPRWAQPLGFDCLITYDSLVDHYVEVVTIAPVDHFSWDPSANRSFKMMTDSSSRVSQVKDI